MTEVDLSSVSREDLEYMALAATQVTEAMRVLGNTGDNIVGELLKTRDEDFTVWQHYPPGDVRDPNSHSQFYYHAHPEKARPGEHGHFHTFMRLAGIPSETTPSPLPGNKDITTDNKPMGHLVAISMSDHGLPIALFTVNRWVTDDIWYDADDCITMLDDFIIDTAQPSWPVNMWVSAMLLLFRPQIEQLLRKRDEVVSDWVPEKENLETLNDKDLEITSLLDISLADQITAVQRALEQV